MKETKPRIRTPKYSYEYLGVQYALKELVVHIGYIYRDERGELSRAYHDLYRAITKKGYTVEEAVDYVQRQAKGIKTPAVRKKRERVQVAEKKKIGRPAKDPADRAPKVYKPRAKVQIERKVRESKPRTAPKKRVKVDTSFISTGDRAEDIKAYIDRAYHSRVKNGVYNRTYNRYGRRHMWLDEAYQDVVTKVHRLLLEDDTMCFDNEAHFANYILTAVYNTIAARGNHWEERSTVSYNVEYEDGADMSAGFAAEDDIPEDEIPDDLRLMRYIIKNLMSDEQRELIQLEADGVPYADAAEMLGWQLNTYKSRVYAVRQFALKQLEKLRSKIL